MKLTSGLIAAVISPANPPVMELVIWQVTAKNPQLLLAAASAAGAGRREPAGGGGGGGGASAADGGLQDGEDDGGEDGQAVADRGGPQGGLGLLDLGRVAARAEVAAPADGQEQGGQAGQDPDDPQRGVA